MRTDRRRRGVALVEVLISLVVLAVSGTALITLLGQTSHSIQHVQRTEVETRGAAAQLSGLVALERPALAARAGRTSFHGWTLIVDPVTPELFDVSIAASDTTAPLLRTTIYRPDSTHAPTP